MNKYYSLWISLLLLILDGVQGQQGCSSYRIRKEFRDLSSGELEAFRSAMKRARDTGIVDSWAKQHIEASTFAHESPHFLPWHRGYLLQVEKTLMDIDSRITGIPYWDWNFDAADPLSSPIFGDSSSSRSASLFPVQAGFSGDCSYPCTYPEPHCLVRNYDPDSFSSFLDPVSLQSVIRNTRGQFDQFRQLLEAAHDLVHRSIGGEGGDMSAMQSPNDPIFWLHHSNIDRIWWTWQTSFTSQNFRAYDGEYQGTEVSDSDPIDPSSRLLVRDVFDLQKSLCVKYQPFSQSSFSHNLESNDQESSKIFGNNSSSNIQLPSKLPNRLPDAWVNSMKRNATLFRMAEDRLAQIMEQTMAANAKNNADGSNDNKASSEATTSFQLMLLCYSIIPILLLLQVILF